MTGEQALHPDEHHDGDDDCAPADMYMGAAEAQQVRMQIFV